MVGGDGACMGCGEKTTVHLVTSTIEALMQPRVKRFVARLDGLIAGLDARARELLAADADLDAGAAAAGGRLDVPLGREAGGAARLITASIDALKDLRWRYTEGPSGRGRASLGITNSTGCSSVWGAPIPSTRTRSPGSTTSSRTRRRSPSASSRGTCGRWRTPSSPCAAPSSMLADGSTTRGADEAEFEAFDWQQFTDEEFASARRCWRSAATARCSTSASRTSRGCWRRASRSG
jgi:pyruvate-ferredoxin/flavodoxin oxidoreductase